MKINLDEVHTFEMSIASECFSPRHLQVNKQLNCVVRYDPNSGESSCYYQVLNFDKSVCVTPYLSVAVEKFGAI
jgi:hypothetical protein